MAFNILSGSVASSNVEATGSFSGSFTGNGSGLTNTNQFILQNPGDELIPFYKYDGDDPKYLNSNVGFNFNPSTTVLTVPKATITGDLTVDTNTLHVDSTQNRVGIGTTNPNTHQLEVHGGDWDTLLKLKAVGANSGMSFEDSDGNEDVNFMANGNGLKILTGGSNTRMLIGSSGDVGIGTTSPIAKLDVAGKIAITSESSTPAQPADGQGYLYTKSDGKLYWRSYDITEMEVGGGSVTITNDADNRITTANGSGGIVGESDLTFNGTIFAVNSGVVFKRRTITNSDSIGASDYYIGVANSTAGGISVTLPDASTLTNGQTFIIKDEAGNAATYNITINTTSAQTIDGVTSVLLTSPYAAINLYTNGSNKFFIY